MKPLLRTVVALCLVIASFAHPENIEDVKELPQKTEPIVEAEESETQIREERCTTCKGGANLKIKGPNEILAAIQALPGGEVHSQSSFESCSSDKGCAGLKVKDGRVVERFGNVDALKAAVASDTSNEFTFHAAGSLGNVFEGGIPKDGPFWWMNQNSPFKAGATGNGGNFEKFSKSSASFSSSGGAGAGGAGFGLDLSGNPFLNGDFSKLAGGATGFGASGAGAVVKPGYQSSAFESSTFSSSNKGEIDLSQNPFLNGGLNKFGASGSGFQAQGSSQFGASGQGSQAGQFGASGQGSQAAFGVQASQGAGKFAAQGGQGAGQFGSQGSQSSFGSSLSGQGTFGSKGASFGAGSGQGQAFGASGIAGQGAQGFNGGASHSSFGQSGQATYSGNGQNAFGAGHGQGAYNSGANQGFAGNAGFSSGSSKFATSGYTGSSPSPFTASTAGSNINLIQNTQKTSEYDLEQQQQTQTNIDQAFQGTGNVQAHQHSGGALQQTCAGQGYVCVHKAQCNNGVVNTNGASVLQAKTKKQYCNTKTEICCRIEVSTLAGANELQGSVGFGSATYNANANANANRQGGLFVSSNQGSASGSNFGASGQSGQAGFGASGQSGQPGFGASQSGSSFGSSSTQRTTFGASGTFGQAGQTAQTGQGSSTFGSSNFGASRGSSFGQGTQGFGAQGTGLSASGTFGSGSANRESSSSTFGSAGKFGAGATFGVGSTVAPTTAGRFGGNEVVYKQTSQSNFVETDSFSAGSENTANYRPGASGSGLKPGIPYLPPDNPTQPTNVVSSTAFITTPRPFTTPRPTYLPPPPPSTAAPGYLPPQGEQTINTETRLPGPPTYVDGQLILDETRQTQRPPVQPPPPSEPASGCAAALKCTPIEYCTAEGVISNTTVVLTRDQEVYRVPLTDCKDVETGRVGKCCRDPYYTDPWPTNQLGKWVPGVFGGNDGKYVADNRGSSSVSRPAVTNRPFVTGSTLLNNFRTSTQKPAGPYGPNQVTPGYPQVTQSSFGQKGQFEVRQQGQFGQGGQGQFAVAGQGQAGQSQAGQFAQGSQFNQNSFSQRGQSQGQYSSQGQGQYSHQGQGQYSQQGQGQYSQGGRGQIGIGGQLTVQGQRDQSIAQSQRGQAIATGQGQLISQGFGQGVRQGQGFSVENEYSESASRVFLQQYSAGGQCGLFNGQKPYGNRNELEVDFAEIPWQAMVLLQTNKSLLCGGVITRPDVVLTSAACVDGLQAKNVLIKGGEWKLGIDDEPLPFQIVQVKTILRHPFYKRGSLHYDVAILVLSENLRFAKNIYPICLPGASDTLDAFYNGAGECIVTGWGRQVLQAHLAGAIMHSLNVSLINPGECQAKLSQDYPHLLEQYDQDSCACGQPTNPINNICKVDTGSALACSTGDGHWTLRGVYSWDSGCQPGDQLAAFYKFDLEWYEWAIGLIESARFAQFSSSTQQRYTSGAKGGASGGIKGGFQAGGKVGFGQAGGKVGFGQAGGNFGQYNQFSSKFSESSSSSSSSSSEGNVNFATEISAPISNSFSASFSEKKVFQSEPKIVTYTTKPEYFTYTTKPKLVTYTTKPQIITYETSGSATNPQFVAPGVTFNPSFSELVGAHKHNAACKCLDGNK